MLDIFLALLLLRHSVSWVVHCEGTRERNDGYGIWWRAEFLVSSCLVNKWLCWWLVVWVCYDFTVIISLTPKGILKKIMACKEPDRVDLRCMRERMCVCVSQILMIEVFWEFPISVTTTAGGPSWYILLCVCVCVEGGGCVCAVIGCGVENTCWGTTVATGIPEKIRKMNSIVRILNPSVYHNVTSSHFFLVFTSRVEMLLKWLTPVQICWLSAGYEPSGEFGWQADWQHNKYFFSLAASVSPLYLNGNPLHLFILLTIRTLKQRYRMTGPLSWKVLTKMTEQWALMRPDSDLWILHDGTQ